ncbi:hypothetical protein ACFQOY_08730 [Enterococcus alcedinis]|uniref:Uncharacterized protein n=1 Tax=Enterococcus alcedinis TaxID=1274384 RepID=A0A917JD28_9ENTE|nr:hypothetical protein [Enterococcus alcedinis]MBP2101585.1 hypothetical protein [Enterococcus alcedinis]GGI65020.1 hypothetical protein GCM10011482_06740 [Enterococcus alcedinis]
MKKKALSVLLIIILFMILGLFFYRDLREKEQITKKNEALLTVKSNQSKVGDMGKWTIAIDDLTDEAGFLVSGIRLNDLTSIQEELLKLKNENENLIAAFQLAVDPLADNEKAEEKLRIVQQKFDLQNDIMVLFDIKDQYPISGSSFNSQVPLKLTTTTVDVQKLQMAFKEQFREHNDAWTRWMDETLIVIDEQADLVQKALELIDRYQPEEAYVIEILINNIKAPETKRLLSNKLKLKIS